MIFGFNTDIKVQATVYHVQTELREHEHRLESQVFVSGRCIGKRSAALPADAADEQTQELARAQHSWIVNAVREGFVDDVLSQESPAELELQFLGSERLPGDRVVLRFRVVSGGSAVPSVQVGARWKIGTGSGVLGNTLTDTDGVAEMHLALADGQAELEIRASLEGRETARQFIVKSARA